MREHPALAAFAFLATATSGLGQTFFISVFGSGIRESFTLSHGNYGLTYSLATLISAGLLLKLGSLADRWAVTSVTTLAVGLLAAGCLVMGLAQHWIMLVPGFLLVRLGGQAMLSHLGVTVAGRYFVHGRGRIMALTAAGFPVAEAVLPLTAGLIMLWGGWRLPWLLAVAVLLLVALPTLLLLARHAPHPSSLAGAQADSGGVGFTRAQVLRDPGFYRILPAAVVVPFTVTAVLFHKSAIGELRDWSQEHMVTAFTGFALGHLFSLLFAGSVVDRLGAQRTLSLGLVPIFLGMLILAFSESVYTPYAYLAVTGVSLGFTAAAGGAIWPERYGIRHIGAIRAVAQATMVLSTALSPLLVGALLDGGISTRLLASLMAVLVLVSALLATTARKPL
ncbi:MAG: MFS transporter [Halomonadaceae bacterium]|nr:MAG: MFS transporter [Halomonadaceae bacterium]